MKNQGATAFVALVLGLPWLAPLTLGPSPWVLQSVLTGLMAILAWLWLIPLNRREAWHAGVFGLAWSLAGAALLSSMMGLVQLAGWSAGLDPWISSSDGIAYANLRQRNLFATLTVLGVTALFYLVRHARTPLAIASSWLALTMLTSGNAASASRTGLVGLVIVLGLCGLWWRSLSRTARWLAGLALPLYGVAAFGWVQLGFTQTTAFTRLAQGDDPCSSRMALWSNVMQLVAQKPWTGWGWSELAYAHFITLFTDTRFCAILDNAHNLPLHIAVTLGLPAAIGLCAGAAIWALRQRPWDETEADRQLAWGMLAMLMLHSLLEYPLWYGPFQLVALASVLLLILPRQATGAPDDSKYGFKSAFRQHWQRLIAMFLIAILGCIAWDYYRVSQVFLPPSQRAATYRDDPLRHIQGSWLFRPHVQFAELSITPLTAANAGYLNALAKQVLHFSPEAIVVQKIIESAVLLGRNDEALYYLERFQAAFPAEHKAWASQLHLAATQLGP